MKEIKVFQTADKKTFEDKGEAVRHELMIELRGLLQSGSAHENVNSPTAAATLLAKQADAAAAILSKFRKRIAGIEGQKKKKATV